MPILGEISFKIKPEPLSPELPAPFPALTYLKLQPGVMGIISGRRKTTIWLYQFSGV